MPPRPLAQFADLRPLTNDVIHAVRRLEEERAEGEVRRAVFDLDNTLLIGDIGESVLARLLLDKAPVKLTWTEYRRMLATDPPSAYLAAVDAMRGLEVSAIYRATFKVLTTTAREWSIEGSLVAVPRPHPVMRALVVFLGNMGYATHVITASHQIIARIACMEWLGIPEERVHGIRSELDGDILTDRILGPIPIGSGKRDVYRTFIGTDAPMIAAGDSPMDIPMIDMVRPNGLVLWVGGDKLSFELLKGRIGGARTFQFVHRPTRLTGLPTMAVA